MADVKDTPAVARLRATLSKTYRIQIADGRSFMGSLCLLDKEKNIILSDTLETTAEGGVERDVGMIMIPWKWVIKAEIEDREAAVVASSRLYI